MVQTGNSVQTAVVKTNGMKRDKKEDRRIPNMNPIGAGGSENAAGRPVLALHTGDPAF